jgi:hypothetical protein
MCRNIKVLFNFDPPATDDEIREASLQYVRKLSGFTKPTEVNQEVFDQAVNEVSLATKELLKRLKTTASYKDREVERQKTKQRSAKRFGTNS